MLLEICAGWQDDESRYIHLSLSFLWRSVVILPSSMSVLCQGIKINIFKGNLFVFNCDFYTKVSDLRSADL